MRLASALLAWLIVSSPSLASACSVCTAGRDEENAAAFLISTIFMSLTPLIALGTLLYVIRRRYLKLEADAALPAALPAALSADDRESEVQVSTRLATGS